MKRGEPDSPESGKQKHKSGQEPGPRLEEKMSSQAELSSLGTDKRGHVAGPTSTLSPPNPKLNMKCFMSSKHFKGDFFFFRGSFNPLSHF